MGRLRDLSDELGGRYNLLLVEILLERGRFKMDCSYSAVKIRYDIDFLHGWEFVTSCFDVTWLRLSTLLANRKL